MYNTINNKKRNDGKKLLLFWSFFLHIFSFACSLLSDYSKHREKIISGGTKYFYSFLAVNFLWWSSQTSVITIVYYFYYMIKKLINKKSFRGVFDKVIDLVVINANIVSFGIFLTVQLLDNLGICRLLPVPNSKATTTIFGQEVNSLYFWWFYAIIWHYIAPLLAISYFVFKYKGKEKKLAKTYSGRLWIFICSFIHPLVYFALVVIKPHIEWLNLIPFSNKVPGYPYVFFRFIDLKDNWFFEAILVIFFWFAIFWASTLFFLWYSKHNLKDENKQLLLNGAS